METMHDVEISPVYFDILLRASRASKTDEEKAREPTISEYIDAIFVLNNGLVGSLTRQYCNKLLTYLGNITTGSPLLNAELIFCTQILKQESLGNIEIGLLKHLRIYCIFIQFLRIHEVDPEDPVCTNFLKRLFESYGKLKKQLSVQQYN